VNRKLSFFARLESSERYFAKPQYLSLGSLDASSNKELTEKIPSWLKIMLLC
jgi:hypothetical protein